MTGARSGCHLLDLPDELLHEILSHAHDDADGDRDRPLEHVAMTCRRLRAAAEPFLWRQLRLKFFARKDFDNRNQIRTVIAPWSDRLLREICYRPAQARYVHELKISLRDFGPDGHTDPRFEQLRDWMPDHYDELWDHLRADTRAKLEQIVRKFRNPAAYTTAAAFETDFEEIYCADNYFEDELYNAFDEYYKENSLNETEDEVRCYPLSYLPFDNFPALRTIILFDDCDDFATFERQLSDWPGTMIPNGITIQAFWQRPYRSPLKAETTSALREWAQTHEVRLLVDSSRFVSPANVLFDSGPFQPADSDDTGDEEGEAVDDADTSLE